MTSIAKALAYGLGGVTLMGGSFILFASLSGTPLSEVTGLGELFPGQATGGAPTEEAPQMLEEEVARDPRPPVQVVEGALSPLHAFVLPSPFSASELEDLERALQNRMRELDLREHQLDERERELDEEQRHYRELFAELEGLRTALLEMDSERTAQAEELTRDQQAFDQRQAQAFRNMAKIYEEGRAKDMAQMLSDVWSPAQAAQILDALAEDRAGALLAEIYQLDRERGAALQEAYHALQGGR